MRGPQHGAGHAPPARLTRQHLHYAHRRQPRLLLVGSGHHVPVGLRVVGHALAAEVLAQLVDELPLLSVHRRERVRARLLFRLLSEVYELGELVVHVVGEGGLALGGGAHVLAVARRQLGGHVRVADLQRQRHLPRARLHAALVVALQRFEHIDGALCVGQVNRASLLDLGGRKSTHHFIVIPCVFEAGSLGRFPFAGARGAHGAAARRRARAQRARAARRAGVARGAARVPAARTLLVARLGALAGIARSLVTDLDAGMFTARERFAAREAARELFLRTRDGFSFLVSTVAGSGGEHDAGRTVPGVARVQRLVPAGARAAARRAAGRGPRAAAHGRQQHLAPARTAQLLEAERGARRAVSGVAEVLTAVRLAGERAPAHEPAPVLRVRAAARAATVPTARQFLITFLLTEHIVIHVR